MATPPEAGRHQWARLEGQRAPAGARAQVRAGHASPQALRPCASSFQPPNRCFGQVPGNIRVTVNVPLLVVVNLHSPFTIRT